MEQWEYLTLVLQAQVKDTSTRDYIQKRFSRKPRRHSPQSMIPELDRLGSEGWELVSMQPVAAVGRNEDLRVSGDGWTSSYFCVFKRRRPGSHLPVSVAAARIPSSSQ